MTPKRIRIVRSAGWKMPKNTIYVGRPTRWSNPFNVNKLMEYESVTSPEAAAKLATDMYKYCVELEWRRAQDGLPPMFWWAHWIVKHVGELAGKNLACWCKLGQSCHADFLLKLANGRGPAMMQLLSSLRCCRTGRDVEAVVASAQRQRGVGPKTIHLALAQAGWQPTYRQMSRRVTHD